MAEHATEEQFVKYFNKKKFGDLNERQKEFIIMLNDGVKLADDSVIMCCNKTDSVAPNVDYKSIVGLKKQKPKRDIVIEFEQKVKKVSLKSGGGNSSHQEPWSKFEKFLKHLGATKKEINAFDDFIHSRDIKYFEKDGEECPEYDFTKDDPEFCDHHPTQRKLMQGFLDRKKRQLLEHVLKKGYCSEEGWAEYIFHGTKDKIMTRIKFEKMDSVIEKIIKSKKDKGNARLYLGVFTFQRWNVCPRSKNKLDSMQVKIGQIIEYLK